jgi:hypothetical protein
LDLLHQATRAGLTELTLTVEEEMLFVKNTMEIGCGGAVISALGRLRQEDCEFKASFSYIARPCLKTKQNKI